MGAVQEKGVYSANHETDAEGLPPRELEDGFRNCASIGSLVFFI